MIFIEELQQNFKDLELNPRINKYLNWTVSRKNNLNFSIYRYSIWTLENPRNPRDTQSVVIENNYNNKTRIHLN